MSWDYIDKKFIKNSIPSERKIENAINYIADELIHNLKLLYIKNLNLCTKDRRRIYKIR